MARFTNFNQILSQNQSADDDEEDDDDETTQDNDNFDEDDEDDKKFNSHEFDNLKVQNVDLKEEEPLD